MSGEVAFRILSLTLLSASIPVVGGYVGSVLLVMQFVLCKIAIEKNAQSPPKNVDEENDTENLNDAHAWWAYYAHGRGLEDAFLALVAVPTCDNRNICFRVCG